MVSKREILIRLVDVEMECMHYEEDIRELQLKVEKLENKGKKKTTKKTVKKTTKKGKK